MIIKTTMTFYSHPIAKRDIDEWEKLMLPRIIMKVAYLDEKHKLYVLDHGNKKYEFVICAPIEIFNDGELVEEQLALLTDHCHYLINCMADYQDIDEYEIDYYKCVVIGDITGNQLRKMSSLIFKLERMAKNDTSLLFHKPVVGSDQ